MPSRLYDAHQGFYSIVVSFEVVSLLVCTMPTRVFDCGQGFLVCAAYWSSPVRVSGRISRVFDGFSVSAQESQARGGF